MTSERAREIDDRLARRLRDLFMTVGADHDQGRLNMLGFEVGGLRLPLVEASDARARRRAGACSSATAWCASAA